MRALPALRPLVLAAVAAALAPVIAACGPKAPACAPAALAPRGAPFLWRVQRASGPVIWLYGTLHDGRARVPAAAYAALEASARFVSELGDRELAPDTLRAFARVERGKGLDQLLPTDDWWDLRDALRDRIKEDDLKRVRPWFAMTQLTAAMAPTPEPTMDVALARRAKERKLGIAALETWEEQFAALDAVIQIADLQEAIRARKTMRCNVEAMLGAYAAGDLDAMGKLLGAAKSESLLTARNRKWLPALERYLAEGGAFIAVGVSHLAGPQGLPALLEAAGYTVARAGS